MKWLSRDVGNGVLYAAAGVNIAAGAYLIANPFPPSLPSRLAQKFGGDEKRAATDLALLEGTRVQVQGKGAILVGVGALLAAAARGGDAKVLRLVTAFIAAGDLALLALWAAAKQQKQKKPALLDEERAALPYALGYAALEAAALGSYAYYCTH
jgi:hypothetical protein